MSLINKNMQEMKPHHGGADTVDDALAKTLSIASSLTRYEFLMLADAVSCTKIYLARDQHTIGTLWRCSEGTLARQVCRLGAQVSGKIVAELAIVTIRACSLDESVAYAGCSLFSRFLMAKTQIVRAEAAIDAFALTGKRAR